MDKEYKANVLEIVQIIKSLENEEHNMETANRKIEKALTKIQECIEILETPKSNIMIVTEKKDKLDYREFKLK